MPEQLTPHEAPEQLTRIKHVEFPVQATDVVLDLLAMVDAQARCPAQLTLHESPAAHVMALAQVSTPVHRMSQAAEVQICSPVQLPAPTHPTLHASPAHWIVLVHDPSPTQLMAHELAPWQSI